MRERERDGIIKSPCKDCPDRHIGCHSSCEKYLKYRSLIDADAKKREKKRIADDTRYASAYRNYKRYIKPTERK